MENTRVEIVQTTAGKLEADLRRGGVWLTVVGTAGYFIQGAGIAGLYVIAIGAAAWGSGFVVSFVSKKVAKKHLTNRTERG